MCRNLLARHGASAAEVHAAAASLSCSIRLTKTSSIDGGIGSSVPNLDLGRLQRRADHRLPPASRCSTFTCSPPPNTATSRMPGRPSSAGHAAQQIRRLQIQQLSLAERLLQFRRRAERDHPPAVHQRDAMAVLRFVHVVRGDEDRVARVGKLVDQIPETSAARSDPRRWSARPETESAAHAESRSPAPAAASSRRRAAASWSSRLSSRPAIFST